MLYVILVCNFDITIYVYYFIVEVYSYMKNSTVLVTAILKQTI